MKIDIYNDFRNIINNGIYHCLIHKTHYNYDTDIFWIALCLNYKYIIRGFIDRESFYYNKTRCLPIEIWTKCIDINNIPLLEMFSEKYEFNEYYISLVITRGNHICLPIILKSIKRPVSSSFSQISINISFENRYAECIMILLEDNRIWDSLNHSYTTETSGYFRNCRIFQGLDYTSMAAFIFAESIYTQLYDITEKILTHPHPFENELDMEYFINKVKINCEKSPNDKLLKLLIDSPRRKNKN